MLHPNQVVDTIPVHMSQVDLKTLNLLPLMVEGVVVILLPLNHLLPRWRA